MRMLALISVAVLLLAGGVFALAAEAEKPVEAPPPVKMTLDEYLKAAKPPVFRAGHTLPPLSRWGWQMPFATRVELTEHWGYALEIRTVNNETMDTIETKPDSDDARIVALAASDPKRYPLSVITHRPLGGDWRKNFPDPAVAEQFYAHDANGKLILDDRYGTESWRTVSPMAPDAIFAWNAQEMVAPLLRLRKLTPIAVILNGGEYGLSVPGHGQKFWEQDPKVVAAKGDKSWLEFNSAQKTRQEMPVYNAMRNAFPDRSVYIWYHYAGIPSWDGPDFSNDPQLLAISDLPDQSIYYRHGNTGWTGERDLLTNVTYAVAQAIKLGHPMSYNWVCGGWNRKNGPVDFSDMDRYQGFLKCLYAMGQVGAVAGYFSSPEGIGTIPRFAQLPGTVPPHHLQQMMALGHAHALFSHVEEFLRQGDLLPGPYTHVRNADYPAYEFGKPADGLRVFVRKQQQKDAWLITAWAATGDARDVTITVPELGEVTVQARPAGSVYLASKKRAFFGLRSVTRLELLDTDPMDPTARWRKK